VGLLVARRQPRNPEGWLLLVVAAGLVAVLDSGLYAGVVLLATEMLRFHSAVAVAALFNPLRRWVQRAVDRRFNRARYDAEVTVAVFAAVFAARLTDAVDLNSVRDDLASVVQQALEPGRLSAWVSPRD